MIFSSKQIKEPKAEGDTLSINEWWYHMIRNTWYDTYIRIPWRQFIKGIRNIIKWMPIVWQDRDYDDHYIFKVLQFKIKNTRDHILHHNLIIDEDQERVNRYTSLAIKLIDIIHDETYDLEYLDYFESEMNWHETDEVKDATGEKMYMLDIKEISNRANDFFNKYPRTYREVIKDMKERDGDLLDNKLIAMTMAHKNQDRALHLLFTVLEREIRTWWD